MKRNLIFSLALFTVFSRESLGTVPDHPIITEVFNNPDGINDGPTGRDPTSEHQEYIEIYLPTAAQLNPALNADNLRLTYYEIEGDSSNSNRGFVSQRFDLPALDLNPANGTTAGAVARPSSGVVILGWVDYNVANPPTDLFGTPSTRKGLINGGITASPAGALFIAVNGAQFTGTTNFRVPLAESLIEVPDENAIGIMSNGSNVYLLVNRDGPGYASLADHSTGGTSFADLPGGGVLGLSALLDGIAGNDDPLFVESSQPYTAPSGSSIDLEDVLPAGGVFSQWVAQIAEGSGGGYARRYVDVQRTTEDATSGNEDPATDVAGIYRRVFRSGPFYPTPGAVVFSSEAPRLALPLSSRLSSTVLAGTTGRPGLLCANTGGDWGINVSVAPGSSSNPSVATFAAGAAASAVPGQTEGFPQIVVTVPASAPDGAIATAPVTFTATNAVAGNPAVQDAVQASIASVAVLKPTRAVNQLGAPIETTVFMALEGFGADPGVTNEFAQSQLADYVFAHLGGRAKGTLGALGFLLNTSSNLEGFAEIDPLRQSFPATEADFINRPGPPGRESLTATVLNSAKVLGGSTAYDGSINLAGTAVRAIELPIPETVTRGGTFSTGDFLYFAEANGGVNESPRSGLNDVTTSRTFELALIDTNVTGTGIESGDSDDFGLIVEVGQVAPGAPVAPGQFLFLSYMGGLEGEDVDTLDTPGTHATVALLLDLDNLSDVLGIETITRLFVVDADVGGTLNVIEAISLNAFGPAAIPTVGGWACVVLTLLILSSATIIIRQSACEAPMSALGSATISG